MQFIVSDSLSTHVGPHYTEPIPAWAQGLPGNSCVKSGATRADGEAGSGEAGRCAMTVVLAALAEADACGGRMGLLKPGRDVRR